MTVTQCWKTEDGKTFDTLDDARAHEPAAKRYVIRGKMLGEIMNKLPIVNKSPIATGITYEQCGVVLNVAVDAILDNFDVTEKLMAMEPPHG